MNKIQNGFTLIELMIVVAIIAILAAIAIPAYQDYVIRSQVSEGASLAEGSKTAVAEFFSNKGIFPKDNTSAGVSQPSSIVGNYVESVTVSGGTAASGTITVKYNTTGANKAIQGSTLAFVGTPAAGSTQQQLPMATLAIPSSPSTASPSGATRSPKVEVYTGAQLGPSGYGRLQLGMTADQATKAGIALSKSEGNGSCDVYTFSGGGVPGGGRLVLSSKLGVVMIGPSGATHTPEKIGKGSSKDDVYSAYPAAQESPDAGLVAPAGSNEQYIFAMDSADEKVQSVHLSNVNRDCAG